MQAQFLLFLLALIPLCNCAVFFVVRNRQINILSKFFPIIFLAILFALKTKIDENVDLIFLNTKSNISFGLDFNKSSFLQFLLFGFLWLIFAFYSHRLLRISKAKFINEFKLFFACFIAIINLIFLAKNLLSLLFFYSCLIFLCHFFALKFICTKEGKFLKIFSFIFFAQIVLFLAAVFLTYQLTGSIDFKKDGIFLQELSPKIAFLSLALYFLALFLIVIVPFYLLCFDITIDLLFVYVLFFLSYGFVGLAIFIKLLNNVFGAEIFNLLLQLVEVKLVEWLFFIAIAIVTFMLVLSNTIKSSFFYLFFQQLIFAVFSIILFGIFMPQKTYFVFIEFTLNMTLTFIAMSNLLLYLNKAGNKSLFGLFYDLKVTVSLLFFALLGFFGISPSIALFEKIALLKIIARQDLMISRLIVIINFFGLIVIVKKLLYPLFAKTDEKKIPDDVVLAKNLDSDSALILSGFVIVVMLVLSFFSIFS